MTTTVSRTALAVSMTAALALWPACADDPDGEPHGDPVEEAVENGCEHLTGGPEQAVTAGSDAASAADVTFEHARVVISLVGPAGQQGGFVSFSADAAGDVAFLWSRAVPVTMTDGTGAVVTPEETLTAPAACGDAAVAHVFSVEVGTYTLELGPTSEPEVQLVFEEIGGEHAN